jgi:ABC-2 type transport system permease protein
MERRMRTFERYLSAPISLISVLWGKAIAGILFGAGIATLATALGVFAMSIPITDLLVFITAILLSAMTYSAMGILFASIPTASPGQVIIPLNFVRIPLMFISGMFIPLGQMPKAGVYAAFLSPLTHTLDLLKFATGEASYFGITLNIFVLFIWMILFLYIGQFFHKIIMKRE